MIYILLLLHIFLGDRKITKRIYTSPVLELNWYVIIKMMSSYQHRNSYCEYFFKVKLTFEMLTVRGQQYSFSTHERVFKVLETENVSTRGRLEPQIFGFMPNALTYWAIRARHLLSHVFEHWLWRYRYLKKNKVNIWNVNCARATAFIFDTRTGVLVKVSKFLRQKMSLPEGDLNPQLSDSCWML